MKFSLISSANRPVTLLNIYFVVSSNQFLIALDIKQAALICCIFSVNA